MPAFIRSSDGARVEAVQYIADDKRTHWNVNVGDETSRDLGGKPYVRAKTGNGGGTVATVIEDGDWVLNDGAGFDVVKGPALSGFEPA